VEKAKGKTVGFVFVIELIDLKGRERFGDIPLIVALSD
jgi:adenine/guanine phosphoribosyltransferase-like PRPP-binding protein